MATNEDMDVEEPTAVNNQLLTAPGTQVTPDKSLAKKGTESNECNDDDSCGNFDHKGRYSGYPVVKGKSDVLDYSNDNIADTEDDKKFRSSAKKRRLEAEIANACGDENIIASSSADARDGTDSSEYQVEKNDDRQGNAPKWSRQNSLTANEVNHWLDAEVAIYKVANKKMFSSQEGKPDDLDELENCIITKLCSNDKIENIVLECDREESFRLAFFHYKSEEKGKSKSQRVGEARQMKRKKSGNLPGNTATGFILAFFRFCRNQAEIFLLCNGYSYTAILHYTDSEFRTKIAKQFLSADGIKRVQTYNIAGPDVTVDYILKENAVSFLQRTCFIDNVISSMYGVILKDSKLYECVKQKELGVKHQLNKQKELRLDIGSSKVKICKKMKYGTWAKVLEVFSEICDENIGDDMREVLNEIDAVRKEESIKRIESLNLKMVEKLAKCISGDILVHTADIFLSDKFAVEFALSGEFSLKYKSENGKTELVQTWFSSPSVYDAIEAIKANDTINEETDSLACDNMIKILQKDRLILRFKRRSNQTRHLALQTFCHGAVTDEDTKFYKIAGNWYTLTSFFYRKVDGFFAKLVKNSDCDQEESRKISKLLKYPWRYRNNPFDVEDVEKILNITSEEACRLMAVLCEDAKLTSADGKLLLTKCDNMYLLPVGKKPDGKQTKVPQSSQKKRKEKNKNTVNEATEAKRALDLNSHPDPNPHLQDNEGEQEDFESKKNVKQLEEMPSTSNQEKGVREHKELEVLEKAKTSEKTPLERATAKANLTDSNTSQQKDSEQKVYNEITVPIVNEVFTALKKTDSDGNETPKTKGAKPKTRMKKASKRAAAEVNPPDSNTSQPKENEQKVYTTQKERDDKILVPTVNEAFTPSKKPEKEAENKDEIDNQKTDSDGNETAKKPGAKLKRSVQKEYTVTREDIPYILWKLSEGEKQLETPVVIEVLKKPRQVCCKEQSGYRVEDPILSEDMSSKITKLKTRDGEQLKQSDVISFLRSMRPLLEGHYNELYLYLSEDDFEIIPGDRVKTNEMELFDILIHDYKSKVTYLVHNKDGMDGSMREACAQIRCSADSLWHDITLGKTTSAEIFFEAVTETEKSCTVYRQLLKKKLKWIGLEKFKSFFEDGVLINFVLGFRHKKQLKHLETSFKLQFSKDDFDIFKIVADLMDSLMNEGMINVSGEPTVEAKNFSNKDDFIKHYKAKGELKKRIDSSEWGPFFDVLGHLYCVIKCMKSKCKAILQEGGFLDGNGHVTDESKALASYEEFTDKCKAKNIREKFKYPYEKDKDTQKMIEDAYRILMINGFERKEHSEFTSLSRPLSGEGILKLLQKGNFVDGSGYLTDACIGLTKDKFMKTKLITEALGKPAVEAVYSILNKGRIDISTYAKLELLTLDRHFSKYQIGGKKYIGWRYLQFQTT